MKTDKERAIELSKTIFSPCRKYRYTLWREWSEGEGYAMFIGLNPSTADEINDDPTIRRCINYAKDWGYNALCMTNMFAYRATDPRDMKAVDDPIGPDNDKHLINMATGAGVVIAAWGTHGIHNNREAEVLRLIPNLHCLKLTSKGHPSHPLYLKKDITPVLFKPTII